MIGQKNILKKPSIENMVLMCTVTNLTSIEIAHSFSFGNDVRH